MTPSEPASGPASRPGPGLAPRLDGVLFDIDDTLVDTRTAFARAIDAVARAYLPGLPAERYGEVLGLWRSDPNGHYRAYTRGELDFDTQRHLRAEELQATFGGEPLGAAGYPAWKDLFWGTFEASWAAHDDAASTLDALASAGIRVGAVSNAGVALQTAKLARAGLERVPMLVGVDTFGVGKPDPQVFLEGCRLLGTDPARTAYVGDELDVDARGARDAGLVGVWIDRPGARRGGPHPEDPAAARASGVHVVSTLAEVPALAREAAAPVR